MHILQASSRREKAKNRINAAATELAIIFMIPNDLVTALSVQEKDVMSKQVLEAEAMANLLEALQENISKADFKKDKKPKTVDADKQEATPDENETQEPGE